MKIDIVNLVARPEVERYSHQRMEVEAVALRNKPWGRGGGLVAKWASGNSVAAICRGGCCQSPHPSSHKTRRKCDDSARHGCSCIGAVDMSGNMSVFLSLTAANLTWIAV